MNIMVCYDGSSAAKEALNISRTRANALKAVVHIVISYSGGLYESSSEKDAKRVWDDVEKAEAELTRIGLVTPPGKPVIVKNNFKNVPRMVLAGWIAHEPSNCCPESFYKTSD